MRTKYVIEKEKKFTQNQLIGTPMILDGWNIYNAKSRNKKKRLYFIPISSETQIPIENMIYEYERHWYGD